MFNILIKLAAYLNRDNTIRGGGGLNDNIKVLKENNY